MNQAIVAPSILAADLANFSQALDCLNNSPAPWIHIDVMDGSFVPPITFGDNIVKICRQYSKKFLDVHLMIDQPEKHFQSFIEAGANGITFHLEAISENSEHAVRLLKHLKSQKIQAGIAIKPETNWDDFQHLIPEVDLLLIMTVEPGYGGQEFMPQMISKIKQSHDLITSQRLSTKIQVDGGINQQTGKQCWEAGAEVLVAGSYIFNQLNPAVQIQTLSFK